MEDRASDGKSESVVLIDNGESATEIQREHLQRNAGGRLRPLILGLALIVLPALIVASVIADRRTESETPGQANTPAGGEAEEIVEPAGGEAEEPLDYAANGDDILRNNRYSPIAAALDDVVITASLRSGARSDLFAGPTGQMFMKFTDPAALTAITLDASGQWVAGTYMNSFGLEVLVVGSAAFILDPTYGGLGWELTPVAVGTNGFAWHPTSPGTLAYAENNLTQSTTVTVRGFTTERPTTRRFSAEFPGQLSVWGDWGFAFRQPGPLPFTSVGAISEEEAVTGVNPLIVVAEGIPGTAMGLIAPGRLVIDGAETATILNVRNAVFEENIWFEPSRKVVSFRESPDGRFSVGLLVDRDSSGNGGWVTLFSADPATATNPAEPLFSADGPTVFDWTASGRFVAGYQQAMIGPEGTLISAASVGVYDLERALYVGREMRIDGGVDGSAEPDRRLSVDSLAFSEPVSD